MTTRDIKPPAQFYYWIILLLLGIMLFALSRLLFLFSHFELTTNVPGSDIIRSFLYGFRFDLSILGYLFLPVVLLGLILSLKRSFIRSFINASAIIVITVMSLLILMGIIDIQYFSIFGEHLGVSSYSYLGNFDLIWYMIVSSFPVTQYLIWWSCITIVLALVVNSIKNYFLLRIEKIGGPGLLYHLILLVFLAISIRGGISLSPIDWGSAYFSKHNFANQLSLNGVFTLTKSLYENYNDKSIKLREKYGFYPNEEVLKSVQELVTTSHDSLLEPGKSLLRKTNFDRYNNKNYNVVILVLESWTARYIGALGGNPDATPFFDSLANKGILLENHFATGARTNRGLLSILCSAPSFPGRSIMKSHGVNHPFRSIAEILRPHGYESYFIYGGDLGFDNIGGFFASKGFRNFYGLDDFPKRHVTNKWGVPDHLVYEFANDILKKNSATPFISVILTLSNHEPFVLPPDFLKVFSDSLKYSDYLNAYHYSDWALRHYFQLAEKEAYFNNTIFVLVADHCKILDDPDDLFSNYKIAGLIYCPGCKDILPQKISDITSQVDLIPTILEILGGEYTHESWGRSLLTDEKKGFAYLIKEDTYGYIQDSFLLSEQVGSYVQLNRIPYKPFEHLDVSDSFPGITSELQGKGRAILQLETILVHGKKEELQNTFLR